MRPPMIQIHFPFFGKMALVIHVICVYAHYLNEYFLAMMKWNEEIGLHQP
jgi:hypothetical protein